VISGPRAAVEAVVRSAAERAIVATVLPTSHAFHSPAMAAAAPALRRALDAAPPRAPARPVISTVTGRPCGGEIAEALIRQLTAPVVFDAALRAAGEVDLFLELGPGGLLTGLVASRGVPAIAIDACGRSLRGLLTAVGAAWALGAPVELAPLFAGRGCKPVDLARPPALLANPCERPPAPPARSPATEQGTPPGSSAARPAIGPETAIEHRDPAAPRAPSAPGPGIASAHRDLTAPGYLTALRRAVADAAELPIDAIGDDTRLLEDLHLSSISIAQIVARVVRDLGLAAPRPLTGWARASLAEIAAALADEVRPDQPAPAAPAPAATWVRAFTTVDEPAPPPPAPRAGAGSGTWRWYGADPAGPAIRPIAEALAGAAGGVAIVVVGDDDDHGDLDALVAAARDDGPFLVIDPLRIAGGFARTLQLETGRAVTAVSFDPPVSPAVLAAIRAEAAALHGGTDGGFRAVHIAAGGALTAPVLAVAALPEPDLALGADDVVVVTGGGKGIAAECALALARRTGCRVITVGRRAPADDAALAAGLARLAAAGVRALHVAADVTDRAALVTALAPAIAALGPVTAILHAAAVNEPRAIRALTAADLRATLAPKLDGLHNVLACVDRGRLAAVVAFGSIIARTGLPGEAHYALANDRLRRATLELARDLPGCRCLVLEWSAWAEVGMAERLGRLDALIQRGLSPIAIADGVAMFLGTFGQAGALAITGRLGDAGIAVYRPHALPLARFVERALVHVPEVELVSEVELTPAADRYLDDHVIDGARVMPAVLQIEAAHQVVAALTAGAATWRIAELAFPRAIVVDDDGVRIRIAACLLDDGRAEVAITASSDRHTAECMRMTLVRDPAPPAGPRRAPPPLPGLPPAPRSAALPAPYGELLPQRGRFARITGYQELTTRRCRFTATTANRAGSWFAHHAPAALRLADPGVRDAILHGMQAAVPHHRLVPVAARDVRLAAEWPDGEIAIEAWELAARDGEYTWSLVVRDAHGAELERWSEVVFRSLGPRQAIPAVAFAPWLERCLADHAPAVQIAALDPAAAAAAAATTAASRALRHRPDGRPERDGVAMSATTGGGMRLEVIAPREVACDLEPIEPRTAEVWRDLLGRHIELAAELARRAGEPLDRAATRVWTALECAAKLGQADPPLRLVGVAGHAATLRAGTAEVLTAVCHILGQGWVAVAVAVAPPPAGFEAAS
jgi:enediyne polyketide synthase